MKDVGEFNRRNKEFDLKFNQYTIITKVISSDSPIIFWY